MGMLEIKPLSSRALEAVVALARSCGKHLETQGIYQWHENYPAPADFQKDLALNRIWGGFLNEELLGFVVYTTQMSPAYKEVKWACSAGPNAYVHRLAVAPTFQRQGFAGLLMDFCEARAQEEGCVSIRLDAYSQNPINLALYEKRGYQNCGVVYYPHKNPHPFICLEKPCKS